MFDRSTRLVEWIGRPKVVAGNQRAAGKTFG
jgi:hypothetical protein